MARTRTDRLVAGDSGKIGCRPPDAGLPFSAPGPKLTGSEL